MQMDTCAYLISMYTIRRYVMASKDKYKNLTDAFPILLYKKQHLLQDRKVYRHTCRWFKLEHANLKKQ